MVEKTQRESDTEELDDDQFGGTGDRFDPSRRDFMKATGVAGVGLPALSNAVAAGSNQEFPGWLLYHRDQGERVNPNHADCSFGTSHFLNYVDVSWSPVGDPTDNEGGCWKHTFLLTGITSNVWVEGQAEAPDSPDEWSYRPNSDSFHESVVRVDTNTDGVGEDPDSDHVAVAARRDSSLLGFIDVEENDDAWQYEAIDVEEFEQNKSMGELVARSGEYDHQRLSYRDLVNEDEDLVKKALAGVPDAMVGVGVLAGSLVFTKWFVVAGTVYSLAKLWTDDKSVDLPPRAFNQSFDVRLDELDGSVVGHYAIFDVYVSPNESGTVGIHSKNPFVAWDRDFLKEGDRLKHGFNPCPQIELNVEGLGDPYDNDYDEKERYTAEPVRRITRGSKTASDFTNVPFRLIGDNSYELPTAEISCERAELPVPGEEIELDASGSTGYDDDLDYLWEINKTAASSSTKVERDVQEWTDTPGNVVTLDESSTYRFVLTVEDSAGNRDSDEIVMTVKYRDAQMGMLLQDYNPCEDPMDPEPSDPEPTEDDIDYAVSLWQNEEEVPGTGGETASTDDVQKIVQTWNEKRVEEGEI